MKTYKDGDQWCAVGSNFVNLQESPAGFGDAQEDAVEQLVNELERQLAQAEERERQDLLLMRQAHDLITCTQKGSESWEKARAWLLSDLHGRIGD